ncbi:DUF1330 domain-containing protein [Jiulongibacter sp. NS-SX5]|uniref:DUF1330 domain-containing protein n=1 Tax=Jiulongibacter sp. NS-SX5 TaxID=3463854 RepID=UPI00405864A4
MNKSYIDASPVAGKAFFLRGIKGPFLMLNLLKFNEEANYEGLPHLAPEKPITGKDAYDKYMEATLPFLKEAGSEIILQGKGGPFLIGPEFEKWDMVLILRHASVEQFMAFAQNKDYLKIAGHRTAALADSRLLPIEEF